MKKFRSENKTDILQGIQNTGAHRHPQVWFMANRAAVNVMRACGVPMNFEMKQLVGMVTLRVLDATQPDEAPEPLGRPPETPPWNLEAPAPPEVDQEDLDATRI